jgi:hypothetical protein
MEEFVAQVMPVLYVVLVFYLFGVIWCSFIKVSKSGLKK